jgi:hypothetical protein
MNPTPGSAGSYRYGVTERIVGFAVEQSYTSNVVSHEDFCRNLCWCPQQPWESFRVRG